MLLAITLLHPFPLRNNFMTLDVYYGELTYQAIEQTEAYTLENFFSKSYYLDVILS